MKAARKRLRVTGAISDGLKKLANLARFDAEDRMTRAEYEKLHGIMTECLLPAKTTEERMELAAKDWGRDAGPEAVFITRTQFEDAVFELVDIWTTSVEAAEYLAFIQALTLKVKRGLSV
jgi:hypothetical protein